MMHADGRVHATFIRNAASAQMRDMRSIDDSSNQRPGRCALAVPSIWAVYMPLQR